VRHPPEVLPRIFEPFLHHQPVARHRPRLATVYGIVKQHFGWVEVQSQPGEGTTFSAYLPVGEDGDAIPADRPATHAARSHGSETVLVVEDEPGVRLCVSYILKSHGYSVITACTGVERSSSGKPGKTTSTAPDRHGHARGAQRGGTRQPAPRGQAHLRVIYTTATAATFPGAAGRPRCARFLAKPYQTDTLLGIIRESLDRLRATAPARESTGSQSVS